MKKNLMRILLCLAIIGCSEDDQVGGTTVGGPTGIGSGSDGGTVVNDPFIYSPNAALQDLASYPIGNIVSASKLNSTSEINQTFKSRLKKDYNSITAENDMKMGNMFRGPNNYNWTDGDVIVAYAKANGMRVHGHALLWHESIPGWLRDFAGTNAEFETLVKDYVKATVAHFAKEKMTVNGKQVSVVAAWDVVNEAIDGAGLRSTLFSNKLGPDYVGKIHTWAREADAEVKLFYNDYNVAGTASKRAAILNMVNNLKSKNIPIDGIGFQMHIQYNWPQAADLKRSIEEVSATGLLIHFSELDIKVNPSSDIAQLTEERAAAQEAKYKEVAEHYNMIPTAQRYGITIWGMRDSESWLYKGGTEWPLLYDNDYKFKIAHRGFAQGLK